MKEQITTFESGSDSVVPYSPYFDKTFDFRTFEVNTLKDMFRVLSKSFILNFPLDINEPVRTHRRGSSLKELYLDKFSYVIIDFDYPKSISDRDAVLKYFKEYRCIIGESRSYNGIDNFNLKGILLCNPATRKDIKTGLITISKNLSEYGKLDLHVVNTASFNTPMNKIKVLLQNDSGIKYTFEEKKYEPLIEKSKSIKSDFNIPVHNDIEIKEDVQNIPDLCLNVFSILGFKAIQTGDNGCITFKHPSEVKTIGGYFWFKDNPYLMHHYNNEKNVNIFDTVRKLPQAKELLKKSVDYDDELLSFDVKTNVIKTNERYLSITEDIKSAISDFIDNPGGLFTIRSPMGTGKSTVIKGIIDEAHDAGLTVLIITNRISVAQDFSKKYGMKIYNEDKYSITDSLICQYDSLWKYDLKNFDVVVMDEFISLISHSRSNLTNSSVNSAKFFASFKKKLVIADAFLTGYENFLIEDKTENKYLLDNRYRDPTSLYDYKNKNNFTLEMLQHAKKNKITVSSTSVQFIKASAELFKKHGLNVITLLGETPDSTKELIYNLFEEDDNDKWDVLLFSPTLTVGVSNLNNVKYHFHYDSSMSADVISSIQMMKRTRRAREIHMYISERTKFLCTDYKELRDNYIKNSGKLANVNYLFRTNDYGDIRLSDIGKNAIRIDIFKNILEMNHGQAVKWMLKYHFLNEPITVKKTFESNLLSKYSKLVKQNHKELLQEQIQDYLNLSDTYIEYDVDNPNKFWMQLSDINISLDQSKIDDMPNKKEFREEFLERCVKKPTLIEYCKNYRLVFNYTHGIWNTEDVQSKLSKSIMESDHEMLTFCNQLMRAKIPPISKEYDVSIVNANSELKKIIAKCGYRKMNTSADLTVKYRLGTDVEKYWSYIKV